MYHVLQFTLKLKCTPRQQTALKQELEQLARDLKVWTNWQVDSHDGSVLDYGGYIGEDGLPILIDEVASRYQRRGGLRYLTTEVYSSKDRLPRKPKWMFLN